MHPRKYTVLALLVCCVHVPKHNAQEEPAHIDIDVEYPYLRREHPRPSRLPRSLEEPLGDLTTEGEREARVHPRKSAVVDLLER